jgi:4-amino-4-deoxy-L-arabinose transferase-like glycosyltransferase
LLWCGVLAYLLPGILGHDPWKQDETYTFGIIHHMLLSGDLLVPVNAGQPFMEKPPLYDWLAAGLAKLLSPWLPLHDGARLASALCMALALAAGAFTARLAWRAQSLRDTRVLGTVALFACSFGVLKHAHDLFTDGALVAGAACGLYGLLRIATSMSGARGPAELQGACWLGIGVGVTVMTKGVFVPLVFGATALGLPLAVRECRSVRYACALGLAVVTCLPFALIWPALLWHRSPWLFMAWLWDNNVGRFFGFSVPQLGAENDQPLYVVRAMWFFGFPAVPLAALGLLRGGWRRWREPRVAVPLLFSTTGIVVLEMSATARMLYLLPFMLPLSLLGGYGVARLPASFHGAWDWFNRIAFTVAGALVWIVWYLMRGPLEGRKWLTGLGRWLPLDYAMPEQPWAVAAALAMTLGWLYACWRITPHGWWRGIISWSAGLTLAWGLVFTLLLPWINDSKSYGPVFADLAARIGPRWRPGDCMASLDLGESEAPMLLYYTGRLHRPVTDTAAASCRWLIVQAGYGAAARPPGNWIPFWRGARQGDHGQSLRVFIRPPYDGTPGGPPFIFRPEAP